MTNDLLIYFYSFLECEIFIINILKILHVKSTNLSLFLASSIIINLNDTRGGIADNTKITHLIDQHVTYSKIHAQESTRLHLHTSVKQGCM